MWCWRRLLRVPWTARRSNQSILKEINPEYSLEGLMLKLKLLATWLEEPTLWKTPWCWERLKTGREGDNRGWGVWMALPTQWTWVWANSWRWWRTGKPGVLQSMGSQRARHDWAIEQQQQCFLIILLMSTRLIVMSCLAFLILELCVFFLSFLVCLAKSLSFVKTFQRTTFGYVDFIIFKPGFLWSPLCQQNVITSHKLTHVPYHFGRNQINTVKQLSFN